jgi:hypothetical protein
MRSTDDVIAFSGSAFTKSASGTDENDPDAEYY